MKVLFRADASQKIGVGHVMRCLTLAETLRERGHCCTFCSRNLPGNMNQYVKGKGFKVLQLQEGASLDSELPLGGEVWDWLVVDHYGLSEAWEKKMAARSKQVLVIDDLADRRHFCNVLLDQNYCRCQEQRYKGLIPNDCKLLLGPRYVLLRREFAAQQAKIRCGNLRRILIFFGGSDPTGETLKTLVALQSLPQRRFALDVVVGAANNAADAIKLFCERMTDTAFHYQTERMAELMAAADLAIGAGGTATWERCALGLPALVITVAKNQEMVALETAAAGAISYLGSAELVDVDRIWREVLALEENPQRLVKMSKCALDLIGGDDDLSGVERVAMVMENVYSGKM